jgi:hypothetical protein
MVVWSFPGSLVTRYTKFDAHCLWDPVQSCLKLDTWLKIKGHKYSAQPPSWMNFVCGLAVCASTIIYLASCYYIRCIDGSTSRWNYGYFGWSGTSHSNVDVLHPRDWILHANKLTTVVKNYLKFEVHCGESFASRVIWVRVRFFRPEGQNVFCQKEVPVWRRKFKHG